MSLRIVTVVASTNTENKKVQMGSATLYSGCVKNNKKTLMVKITNGNENFQLEKSKSMFYSFVYSLVPYIGIW